MSRFERLPPGPLDALLESIDRKERLSLEPAADLVVEVDGDECVRIEAGQSRGVLELPADAETLLVRDDDDVIRAFVPRVGEDPGEAVRFDRDRLQLTVRRCPDGRILVEFLRLDVP